MPEPTYTKSRCESRQGDSARTRRVKEVHATVGNKNGSAKQNCTGDGGIPRNWTSHCVGTCSDGCACIGSLRPLRRGSPVSGREYPLRGRPRGRDKGRPGNSGRSNVARQRSTLNRWRPIGHTRRQCGREQECHHQRSRDRGLRQSLFNERTKSVLPGATTPADPRARLKHCVDLFSGGASCCWET